MNENPWSQHPKDYRSEEVGQLLSALKAGECVSLIGLSGMGKSNLLGYIAHRASASRADLDCVLLDCNRLLEPTSEAFFQLALRQLQPIYESVKTDEDSAVGDDFEALNQAIGATTSQTNRPLTFLLDGFDELARNLPRHYFNRLRALRDVHKYLLSYLIATRSPLEVITGPDKIREFDDLFIANQFWLGPLSDSDARWTVQRFQERTGKRFTKGEVDALLRLSGRHPGLIKALASAWPVGDADQPASWLENPAILRECELLWDDLPESWRVAAQAPSAQVEDSEGVNWMRGGLGFSPVFTAFVKREARSGLHFDWRTGAITRGGVVLEVELTAKESALLGYMVAHEKEICDKDDLIRAVWPEDKVFEQGVRDDSLAQLVRRLRVKIELDPSDPVFLLTVPGRGYRFVASET